MSVQLSPSNSLGFRRPLTQLVKESLTLTNHNVRPVAFKVKTTAPKLYCVRPNSGRVEPGETVEVSVMLQAMKEEPPLNAKCKDKFLIQSTLITQEKEDRPLQEIWNVSDTAGPDEKVHQQKLKVQYLRAEGQTLEEEEEPPVNPSSMMTTGDSQFDTVRQNPISNGHNAAPIPEFSRSFERETTPPADFSVAREEVHHDHHDDTHDEPSFPAPTHVPPPILQLQRPSEPLYEHERPSAPAPAPAPQNDEKIKEAEAEIERLRGLLAAALAAPPPPPVELRKRSRRYSDADTAVSGSDVGTYVGESASPEGVPLQVVVIIALGVFITTYLFF